MKEKFLGFERLDGTVGIRNHLLVMSITGLTGPIARKISLNLPGSLLIDNPYGSGILGVDRLRQDRAMIGFGNNPNIGAVLIISGDPPKTEAIKKGINKTGKIVETITLEDCNHDSISMFEKGIRLGAKLMLEISRKRRSLHHVSNLFVGLECGRSDPSSGMVANPIMGLIADYLIDLGGSAVIGETTEWLGAEHLLVKRAKNNQVKEEILNAVNFQKNLAISNNVNLLGNNPGYTNIEAGLSTIEEKSLGNITKSGTKVIKSVIDWGEKPTIDGMHLMHAPAYAPESLSGFSAAGCQLIFFSTGVGNSFNNHISPSIKISANPKTCKKLHEQLDFKCSQVFEGKKTLYHASDELWEIFIDICSGTRTWGEILSESTEVFSRIGRSL